MWLVGVVGRCGWRAWWVGVVGGCGWWVWWVGVVGRNDTVRGCSW